MRIIFIAAVISVLAVVIVGFFLPSTEAILYPTSPGGGGRYLESPDGKLIAYAQSLSQDLAPNTTRYFYRFEIVGEKREIVASTEIDASFDMIDFREGDGRIAWSDDSSTVDFGAPHQTLWTWRLSPDSSN